MGWSMSDQNRPNPPSITVSADGWFHLGWIACVLGMPRDRVVAESLTSNAIDIESWQIGWDTARETRLLAPATVGCQAMASRHQLHIEFAVWRVDDSGAAIEKARSEADLAVRSELLRTIPRFGENPDLPKFEERPTI